MLVHKHKLTQKDKHKIRSSDEFKKLKTRLVRKYGNLDYITGKELVDGKMTCHHMDFDPANYADYSDESKFILLNENTHRLLHQLYNFYKQDVTILERLKTVMDRMLELSAKGIDK